jgi:uncharacterized membrane protein
MAEDFAHVLHVFGAFSFVSGAVVAAVAFEAARRRRRPSEVALLLGLTRYGVLLVALGATLVLPFGLWLVSLEDVGYGTAWIDAALVLFAAAVALGAAGGRQPKRARLLAERLAREGDSPDERLRSLLDDRPALALNYLTALIVVAIVVLMVVKP